MKISKLLVLTALWLGIASSAKAEVPDGVWTMPDPSASLEFTTFSADYDDETGEPMHFYLYNPAAKMFFASGNSWNTQASVRTFGYPFWVQEATEADAPEGSYELWNYVNNADRTEVTGNYNLFTDDGGSTWVDHASQGNYSWTFTVNGDFVRFQNVALIADLPDTYDNTYIGWAGDYNGDKNSSVLKMIAPDVEGTSIDWRAVTVASYEAFVASDAYTAYTNGVECFFLARDLRAQLVEAEEIGAQVADQLAVYNNTASTKAELTAAIAAAKEAIAKRKQELVDSQYDNATVDNPVVVSDKFLRNYDFKGDDLKTGWSGTEFGSYGPKENAEHYNKTYDTYQLVNGGLKPGVYAVGVKAFYRAGNAQPAWDNYKAQNAQSKYAKLYAKVGNIDRESAIVSPCVAMLTEYNGTGGTSNCEDTNEETGEVTTYIIPNNMEAAEYYMHTLDLYDNKVIIAVNAETDTLRLGVRKSQGVDGDWSIFDDFSLTYYGAGADAAKLYLDEALKNYAELTLEEGTLYTESYLTAYNNLVNGEHSANSLAEVDEQLNAIEAAKAAIDKNIELWKSLDAKMKEARDMAVNPDYDPYQSLGDLVDYLDYDLENVLEDLALTNEEIENHIAELQKRIDTVVEEYKTGLQPNTDVTHLLTNPNFEEGIERATNPSGIDGDYGTATGWNADKRASGNFTPGPFDNPDKNHCFEAWHCHDFDLWQEVKNVPEGVYVIEVQGYVRCEASGYTQGDEVDPTTIPIKLYMNNSTSNFPSVYSEQVPADKYDEEGNLPVVESWSWNGTVPNYPNSMGAAGLCFDWDMYKVTTFGLVKAGDPMRIGVKGKMDTDWWCIWDNFKLTYQGYEVAYVEPALDKVLEQINPDQPMGKEVYEQAITLKARADEAKASGDGKTMFQMLTEMTDVAAAITESVALFAKLNDANESLAYAITVSNNNEAIKAAQALVDEIAKGIDNHTIADAEVADYLKKIADMKTQLAMPSDMASASDDNPVDCSNVIVNNSYDEGVAGWSGTAAAWGSDNMNAEIFGKNFDYYQDINGLPEGTYQVTVQGFYRAGSAANDYKAYTENPDSLNHAFIYAMNGDSIISSKPMKRLAAEANSDYVGSDGYVTVLEANEETGDPGLCVANTMTTAGDQFMNDLYYNESVTVKVLADGKLRIGLKKTTDLTDNWTIFDNWKLTYFGNASAKEADGDPSGIQTIDQTPVMVIEYFTLDGRKASAAHRGLMIQKTTFAGGATIVKKITK